jgi:hypothetical protein
VTDVRWDVPGWDWEEGDYSWLSSNSGIYKDGVSIFFIHGGRIRHQAHVPTGNYTLEEFVALFEERAAGLDDARLCWTEDSGGGSAGLWIEGTRAPNADDLARLQEARKRQEREDRINLRYIEKRQQARERRGQGAA